MCTLTTALQLDDVTSVHGVCERAWFIRYDFVRQLRVYTCENMLLTESDERNDFDEQEEEDEVEKSAQNSCIMIFSVCSNDDHINWHIECK